MPELPDEFRQEIASIGEAADKLAEAGRDNQNMVPAARDLTIRIRNFLTHWQGKPDVASRDAVLAHFRNLLLGTERHIEALHVATLAELLEYRKCRIHADNLLAIFQQLSDYVRTAGPDEVAEILRNYRVATQDENFDPASAFVEQAAEVARQNADYERLIDEYERHWPDRLDDPHYLAILDLKLEQHESIAEELHLIKSSLA